MVKKEDTGKPAPPKRALSAFFLYRAQVYDKVKTENPQAKITELTTIISEMWKKVDAETKTRLEEEYAKNKVQAAKDKAEYQEKYGKIERKKKNKRIAKGDKKGEDEQEEDDE